jgi:uncharacterized protein with ATP-grasp and redox domains
LDEFLTVLEKADIVISKRQVNYEPMEERTLATDKTFFILRVKCPGVRFEDIVLKRNRS